MTNSSNRFSLLLIAAMTAGLAGSAISMQTPPPVTTSSISSTKAPQPHAAAPTDNRPLAGRTILIDPGHGGKDPGAMRSGLEEKDVTLSVSLSLRKKLEALGAKVVLTRSVDTFVPLLDRLGQSNALCPDVFLSVHVNSVKDAHIAGIETYYFDDRSAQLSTQVLDTLAGHLHQSARWSHARVLRVLHDNRAPAVLAEIGYITNPASRARLATGAYQNEEAAGLAAALVAYFKSPGMPHGCEGP